MRGLPPGVKVTPMLSQYLEWKEKYPHCILFFRMGDFYEMFFDDARKASEILDITLTARDPDKSIPMAGVPWHSMQPYLARLVRAGCSVAICDQITEPDGRTLVERKVVRIVTPGTYVPEEAGTGGHLAALLPSGEFYALALLSVETGRLEAGLFPPSEALSILGSFAPGELLVPSGFSLPKDFPLAGEFFLLPRPKEFFSPLSGTRLLKQTWKVASLGTFGVRDDSPEAGCAAAALRYLSETQFGAVDHVRRVHPLLSREHLLLDGATAEHLELVDEEGPSLFSSLNRCRNAMGKRMLREWILRPLLHADPLKIRHDSVEFLLAEGDRRRSLRNLLGECRDIQRATSRLSLGTGTPRDMGALRDTLRLLPSLLPLCEGALSPWIKDLPDFSPLGDLLDRALEEDLPRNPAAGGIIRRGFDPELDEWRGVETGATDWLEAYLERVRAETGISRLKAGFNKIYGYYLEVSRGALSSVPGDFQRKQTLVNAERFVTPEMKTFEEKMNRAGEEISRREGELYDRLREEAASFLEGLQALGESLASLDVLASLAEVARERGYVRPELDDSGDFFVTGGRHPVVEQILTDSPFVPNSYSLEGDGKRIVLLTGPNMAGKSTYLRTAALLILLAQMGSFIPAESARMGLFDRIFTRIGARDDLARGSSTFMVEMVETASILSNLTDRSLVILDEVGRGTSTYDGMSIAWAVLEHLAEGCGCLPKVLFATHFHELTCLEERFPSIVNLSMAVKEEGGEIFFLHQVVRGSADRSYGIEVARLAGLPRPVLKRAFDLLKRFEKEERTGSMARKKRPADEGRQMKLFDSARQGILEELAETDPDGLTPFRALELLYSLREKSREVLRNENLPSS